MTWDPDNADDGRAAPAKGRALDLHALVDGRCKMSSWGPKPPTRTSYENYFGPGGYNRCVGPDGHPNPTHLDEWGNVFTRSDDGRYRTVRTETLSP